MRENIQGAHGDVGNVRDYERGINGVTIEPDGKEDALYEENQVEE